MADVQPASIEQTTWLWRGYGIHYQAAGQGQPLILLHDLTTGTSSYQWRNNIQALSRFYRCYALDLLGFGVSERPRIRYSARLWIELLRDFTAMVTEADPDQCAPHVVVAGKSASLVIGLAAQKPLQFYNLILVNPPDLAANTNPPKLLDRALYRLMARTRLGNWIYAALSGKNAIKRDLQHRYTSRSHITAEMVNDYTRKGQLPDSKYAALAVRCRLANLAVRPLLDKVTNPTLIIYGQRVAGSEAEGAEYVERMPNARVSLLPGVGIMVNDEDAARFNDLVTDFLER